DYFFSSYPTVAGDGKEYWVTPPLRPLNPAPTGFKPWDTFAPSVAVKDGRGTLFAGPREGQHVWIMPPDKPAKTVGESGTAGIAFASCALRVPPGKQMIGVTGLAADADGRIYAATEIGVQVFDPTGRLCGVLAPAAPGKPELLTFEGDQLTH